MSETVHFGHFNLMDKELEKSIPDVKCHVASLTYKPPPVQKAAFLQAIQNSSVSDTS